MSFTKRFAGRYNDLPQSLKKGKTAFILSMITLPVIGFIIFYFAININSILMAFQEYRGIDKETFTPVYEWNFNNFAHLFNSLVHGTGDGNRLLQMALRNTMLFFGNEVLLMLPCTFVISYFLFKKVTGYKFFRVIFYLPNILTGMIMVVSYKYILAEDGPIATLMYLKNGPEGPLLESFLHNPDKAIWFVLGYCIWAGFGANLILFQGGMFRIPVEVLEAASLDGVNSWQELRNIILPMMWNTFSTVFILKLSTLFTVSGPILLFISGGVDPDYSNLYTISYWIFDQVHNGNGTGYNFASAVGLVFTLINAPIVFGAKYILNKIYADVAF